MRISQTNNPSLTLPTFDSPSVIPRTVILLSCIQSGKIPTVTNCIVERMCCEECQYLPHVIPSLCLHVYGHSRAFESFAATADIAHLDG